MREWRPHGFGSVAAGTILPASHNPNLIFSREAGTFASVGRSFAGISKIKKRPRAGLKREALMRQQASAQWQDASTAPLGRNVEVRVGDDPGCYVLRFPCRRTDAGWVHAIKDMRLGVEPTHWREIRVGS
jgi:hypothetical protein